MKNKDIFDQKHLQDWLNHAVSHVNGPLDH